MEKGRIRENWEKEEQGDIRRVHNQEGAKGRQGGSGEDLKGKQGTGESTGGCAGAKPSVPIAVTCLQWSQGSQQLGCLYLVL